MKRDIDYIEFDYISKPTMDNYVTTLNTFESALDETTDLHLQSQLISISLHVRTY